MYGRPSTAFPRSDFLLGHHSPSKGDMAAPQPFQPASLPIPPAPSPDHLIIPDRLLPGLEVAGRCPSSSPSGCSSSYGGSPTSLGSCATTQQPSFIQRSTSSHALYKNGYHCHFVSPQDLLDKETSPVRRVFSTGDLLHSHQRSDSAFSSERSVIIESMSRACKYSPEEKKERIQRYRSKRNQRNFTKKIKYACRKTLADSRPRIRGRFARNEEIEKNPQLHEWSNIASGEEEEDDEDNWTHFLDTFSANYSSP